MTRTYTPGKPESPNAHGRRKPSFPAVLAVLIQAVILSAILPSCREDSDAVGSGECLARFSVEFKDPSPALDSRMRSAAGDAVSGIDTLWVLLYRGDGSLAECRQLTKADFSSCSGTFASFGMEIPYGIYNAYAAANVGDTSRFAEQIRTEEGLKNISFGWNAGDISANRQMFGQFGLEAGKPGPVTVSEKRMSLHAQMRRAASKVTVAFDGSLLEDGVFIYIESVQLKDIPRTCLLGNPNSVTDQDNLIRDGDTIAYAEPGTPYGEGYPVWISRGRPYYPHGGDPAQLPSAEIAHGNLCPAMFFFENMQGKGKDKRQADSDGDGTLDLADKDDKPFGTYVEVCGYYRSIAPGDVGAGPIKYRFMLGKDIVDDYNAERNYHYKLTLRFNRFANDPDWHIEYYEEPPSVIVPDEYYISYLYNKSMDMPVKINTGGWKLKSLKTKIITNNWAPFNAAGLDYASQYDYDANPGNPALNKPWNGFLSLRKTQYTVLDNNKGNDPAGGILHITDNQSYYENPNRNSGYREYDISPGVHTDNDDGSYSLTYNDDKTVDIMLPFYTRAKQLIISTGYTGNNPYIAYRRRARVAVTAEIEDEETGMVKELSDTSDIFQERRVVNPKGVYRKHNSTKPFHAKLKVLSNEWSQTFVPLVSMGTWKAEVVIGDGFVTVNGKKNTSGTSGSEIDFMIGFKGICSESESRCAVIDVEYNYGTCHHLIFVRQGYAPIEMVSGGVKWHTFNLLTKDSEVASPCDEGSLFRFGNVNQPIAASNQKNSRHPWIYVGESDFLSDANVRFSIAGSSDSLKWDSIWHDTYDKFRPTWTDSLQLQGGGRIARSDDFNSLFHSRDIEYGYGVLYDDDASETATSVDDVYGYRSGDAATTERHGMRGCFVYNTTTGRNLFFPIGAAGYGRRKDLDGGGWMGGTEQVCVLRYAGRPVFYPEPGLAERPLFYDLFMRQGAIYWFEKQETINGSPSTNLDINYFSLDFEPLGDLFDRYDAAFIRCVDE